MSLLRSVLEKHEGPVYDLSTDGSGRARKGFEIEDATQSPTCEAFELADRRGVRRVTAKEMISNLRTLGPQDASAIFQYLADHITEARLFRGGRLCDVTDFAAWLRELADGAKVSDLPEARKCRGRRKFDHTRRSNNTVDSSEGR